MSFSVEDYAIEIKCPRGREQEIEILERFGEQKALHRIILLFRDDTFQSGIALICATILNKVAPHCFAHPQVFGIQVFGIARELVKVIR